MSKLSKEEIEALPTILDCVERISAHENRLVAPLSNQVPIPPFYDEGRYHFISDQRDRSVVRLMPTSQSPFTFYRGQSRFYDRCLPSLYRESDDSEIAFHRLKLCEFSFLLETHPVFREVAKITQVDIGALAQHYGLATEYLDITNSKWVAAFFASTHYDESTDMYYPVGRDYAEGYGVLYWSKGDLLDCGKRAGFFDKNKVFGYHYFDRPTRQSSFGFLMQPGEDFNCSPFFDKFFFRHDAVASEIVFNMSYRQRRFIPNDSLSVLARKIAASRFIPRMAVEMCHAFFFSEKPIRYLEEVCIKKGITIRENNELSAAFDPEELQSALSRWELFEKTDLRNRCLPIRPITVLPVGNN